MSRHPWPRASSSSADWLMPPVFAQACASNLLHYNDADLIKVFYSPVAMRKWIWVDRGPVSPLAQAALGESTELTWPKGTYELLELLDIVFPSLTGDVNDMTSSWGKSRRRSLSPPEQRPQFCTETSCIAVLNATLDDDVKERCRRLPGVGGVAWVLTEWKKEEQIIAGFIVFSAAF